MSAFARLSGLPALRYLQNAGGVLVPSQMQPADVMPRSNGSAGDGHGAASIPAELAVLPARDGVLFPGMGMPATIMGDPWVQLLDEAATQGVPVALLAHIKPEEEPKPENLYRVGTAARIVGLRRLPNGAVQVLFQGVCRVRVLSFGRTEPYPRAAVLPLPDPEGTASTEVEALRRTVLDLFAQVVNLSPTIPDSASDVAGQVAQAGALADFCANAIDLPLADKQQVLETFDVPQRLRLVATLLEI